MNIAGTSIFFQPTLQEAASDYTGLHCITKADALHAIVDGRLARAIARGHGNRAIRRQLSAAEKAERQRMADLAHDAQFEAHAFPSNPNLHCD